jgi:hypothetical protein
MHKSVSEMNLNPAKLVDRDGSKDRTKSGLSAGDHASGLQPLTES